MYKEVLSSVDGIAIYPMISLSIFFIFFMTLLIWIIRKDKNYFTQMAQLPLDAQMEGETHVTK